MSRNLNSLANLTHLPFGMSSRDIISSPVEVIPILFKQCGGRLTESASPQGGMNCPCLAARPKISFFQGIDRFSAGPSNSGLYAGVQSRTCIEWTHNVRKMTLETPILLCIAKLSIDWTPLLPNSRRTTQKEREVMVKLKMREVKRTGCYMVATERRFSPIKKRPKPV